MNWVKIKECIGSIVIVAGILFCHCYSTVCEVFQTRCFIFAVLVKANTPSSVVLPFVTYIETLPIYLQHIGERRECFIVLMPFFFYSIRLEGFFPLYLDVTVLNLWCLKMSVSLWPQSLRVGLSCSFNPLVYSLFVYCLSLGFKYRLLQKKKKKKIFECKCGIFPLFGLILGHQWKTLIDFIPKEDFWQKAKCLHVFNYTFCQATQISTLLDVGNYKNVKKSTVQ